MILTPRGRNFTQDVAIKLPSTYIQPIHKWTLNLLVVNWLHDIDLVKYKVTQNPNQTPLDTGIQSPHPRAPPPLTPPEIYKSCMACIYNTQGKCVGMITSSRFQILYKAFYRAKLAGLHEAITPSPASFKVCI
eukprot:1156740-Pelagomonas_calceolata.AAC.2